MTSENEMLPLPKGSCASGMCWDAEVYTANQMHAYARANMEPLLAEDEALRAERDVLARENEAMKRCATKYLGWLGVTHMPLDEALRGDMSDPTMCGDAAIDAAVATQAPSVPEGWAMVPVQPTEVMKAAGCRALGAIHGHYGAEQCWKAMLDAAIEAANGDAR